MNWPKKKKSLKCCLFFYATTMNHFSIGLWCVRKSGFYRTTADDQLSGWTKKKLQSIFLDQTCTKKTSWSLFGGLLPIWSTTAFWIPLKKLLHLRWRNHYIWEVCSANRWDALKTATPAAGIGQQKGPNSFPRQCPTTSHTTKASKVEQIGLWSFASSAVFTWPLANWLPFFQASWQLLAGKMLPQPTSRRQKILSKSLPNPEVRNFTLQE